MSNVCCMSHSHRRSISRVCCIFYFHLVSDLISSHLISPSRPRKRIIVSRKWVQHATVKTESQGALLLLIYPMNNTIKDRLLTPIVDLPLYYYNAVFLYRIDILQQFDVVSQLYFRVYPGSSWRNSESVS